MRRWGAVAISVLVHAGCIKPNEIACGDQVCPVESVCLPDGTCVSSSVVAACDGLADGAMCSTSDFTGTCTSGVCRAPVCGDGKVEATEQCDGSVGVDCLALGYDLGAPTCSARCELDVIDSCITFGWERALPVTTADAWTDGTRFMLGRETDTELYVAGQLVAHSDLSSLAVTGDAQRVIGWPNGAVYGELVYRYIESTGGDFQVVTDLPTPTTAATSFLGQMELGRDDSLYARFTGCQIFEEAVGTSTWQEIRPIGPDDCSVIREVDGSLYAAVAIGGTSASVERYTGSGETWVPAFTFDAPIVDLALAPDGTMWFASSANGFGKVVGGVTTTVGADGFGVSQVVPVGDVVYAPTPDIGIYRASGVGVELLVEPIAGKLLTDAANDVLVAGAGIFRYRGMEYTERAPIGDGPGGASVTLLASGEVVAIEIEGPESPDTGTDWHPYPPFAGIATAAAGASSTDFYVTDGEQISHFANGMFGFGGAFSPELLSGLWYSPGDAVLYAVGAAGTIDSYDGTTLTPLTPPANSTGCDLAAIAGSGTGANELIVVVGACTGVGTVWEQRGGTWTDVYDGGGPLSSVAITSDGDVIAAGPTGGVRFDSTAWSAEPNAIGTSVSATTSADVWVAGGPDFVIHWDGAAWSRLDVIGGSAVLATKHAVYLVGATTSVLAR